MVQGLGKRVPIASLRLSKGRIGKGNIAVKLNDGDSVASALVVGASKTGSENEDLLISTMNGMVLRVALSQCRISSRTAKGNLVVKVRGGDEVSAVTILEKQS